MLLGAVFEVASAAYELSTVVTDVILNYEYINRNWLEEYILSIVFLVVNGVVMGFVGLGIDKLIPDRFSNNTLINKALGFCIGLLQMRVFVETLYAAVASVKSERGDKSAQDDTVNSTGASRTRTVGGHTVSLAEATSEDDGRRGKQLEHGLLYATFIQVIVRDIPLFVLQANATIHYRKWKFIDLFTVFSTFITLTRGTAAYVAKEDGNGMKLLAFVFLVGQFMFRLVAILLLAMTKGFAILVYGIVITVLAILWTAKLRMAHTSHRFVDQLPRAVVFFTFFTLFVVDGSRLTARAGGAAVVKWDEVALVIASAQLTRDKAAEFLRIDKFPPPNIEVYTPEWLVFLRQEKKIPAAGSMLTWAEQQQVQEEAARHEQHCEEVAQQLEEKQARQDKGDESESDEGSDSENSGTRQIVRVPPVEVNSEEVREQQAELNEKNRKLVEERTPIFYKNNPGFRPITESAVPDSKKIKGEGFTCQRSSAVQQNLNAHLTDPLEEMMEFLDVERDKVVSSLKGMRHRVCSVKDFKDMHWVKGRLRDKVIEILETGRLAKLDAKKSNPRLRALVEIARIWGVGPATAAKLYGQGYKSVAELRKAEAAAVLTAQQQIGVKHYEVFLTKIPRAEVHQIEQTVVDEVHKMIPNAIALACGSYRRGKLSSGDCDVLITDPDADTCDILPDLLKRLHASGFLTDDLTHFQKQKTGGCDTYMGVCRVSKDLPYRRLDIKIYPRHFFGFAMLYFTGSDHFNRSMRLFANKNGWSLSDRALTRVMRVNGTKVRLGDSVICESEVDVFIALGLEYKDPTERNCFDIKFIEEDEAKAKRNSNTTADGAGSE
ncbi:hypothetical protein JG688_00009304 [Phytophthora aleatoria]|uniref:DNA-directed DNA polymerase X domain-containing protein n=1 Tax=Phytophthora aleatoria TaxID=2496075 RepID=A0A8J5ILM3_9STRA|nr:hypothetical protein JG688_00009304 [Phytophthora aleatoria]